MKILTIPVGQLMTNCYLVCDEQAKVCAVVDPGDEAGRIIAAVEQSGCEVRYVLLTHGHYDHFTGLSGLLEKYDVPVYIHPADAEVSTSSPWSLKFPRLDDAHQRWYDEGDTLTLGSLIIHVLSTPGHSRGSVCLVVENAILAGDTLFYGSCGRTDFPGGNDQLIFQSLKKLAQLPGDYQVCPGHEEFSTLEAERKFNYYMKAAMGR